MAKMDETIDVLAADIRRVSVKIEKAQAWHEKYSSSKLRFDSHFGESAGKFAAFGLLCIAAMVFDFYVNSRTMGVFARLLHTSTATLAVILTLVDGFLAIQASGLLERRSDVLKDRSMKTWVFVLWAVAFVKILIFVTFIFKYTTLTVDGAQTAMMDALIIIVLPQAIFTLIIYSILHFAGAGLWYYYGNIWFSIRRLFEPNLRQLKAQYHEYVAQLKAHCSKVGVDPVEVERQYHIELETA